MYYDLLVSLIAFIVLVRGDIDLIVNTRHGIIKGTRHVEKDRIFKVYYNVPYAEPPIGNLRFQRLGMRLKTNGCNYDIRRTTTLYRSKFAERKHSQAILDPVPVQSWTGVRDATKPPPMCVQPQTFVDFDSPSVGREDCLYLNVYVPNFVVGNGIKMPVIVYIHGGALQSGSGNNHRADYFMDKNVIFVTMNYRLGVLGFLGMNNDVISGNFGMKDQALALKWIKENIAAFGGDPDNITLMGESAGSGSVHAHMFSPLSKGLFHKAIMQSGNIFSPWLYYDDGYAEALATAFLVTTGCLYKDHAEALKCLQRVPAEDLIKTERRLYVWDVDPTVLFKIIIETNVKNRPFLPHKPNKDTYQTKNIPWIIGMNSGEGAFKTIRYLSNNGSIAKIINSNKKRLLPVLNQYLYTTEPKYIENITREIENYYFNNNEIGLSTALNFTQMLTDSLIMHSMVSSIQTYGNSPRYAYYYDHLGSYSAVRKAGLNLDLGVCHTDELPLLFRDEEKEKKWTLQDKQVSATLLQYWVNFATYSDPNGYVTEKTWTPVKTDGIEYLHIKSDSTIMEANLLKERYDFWKSLPLGRKFA